jgi:hypothetical protein
MIPSVCGEAQVGDIERLPIDCAICRLGWSPGIGLAEGSAALARAALGSARDW